MPLYEYQCEECGVRFERRQSVNDEPVRDCPECGGEVRRLFQPVGIIFKGSGFYVTDNRKAKSSTQVSRSASTDHSSNGASNSKSESSSTESTDD